MTFIHFIHFRLLLQKLRIPMEFSTVTTSSSTFALEAKVATEKCSSLFTKFSFQGSCKNTLLYTLGVATSK